jgi:hypothetical protein
MYILGYIGNADRTSVYFDMLWNITVGGMGAKVVLINSTGNKKTGITVMLSILTDGCKLLPCHLAEENNAKREAAGRPGLLVLGKRVDDQ